MSGGEDKVKYKKNNRTKLALIFVSICLIITIGITLAYYNNVVSISNKLATNEPKVELIEKFSQGSIFLPGEKVTKQVKFSNSGKIDALIRVKYSDIWVDLNDEGVAGNTNLVLKEWTNAWNEEWIDGKDGYFYYTKILKTGTSTNVILDKLALFDDASNDDHDFDYSALTYKIIFELDACMVKNEAAQISFGKSIKISGDDVEWLDYNVNNNINNNGS